MPIGPSAPPGAPFEVGLVMSALAHVFREARVRGDEVTPMLLVADDPNAPITFVPFIDTATADQRADVLWAAITYWPFRPQRRVLFATDAFLRMFHPDEGDAWTPDTPSPSEDARASEVMQVIYVSRLAGPPVPGSFEVQLGAFPYHFGDDGAFHWRPGPGWLNGADRTRMVSAVMAATVSNAELAAVAEAGDYLH